MIEELSNLFSLLDIRALITMLIANFLWTYKITIKIEKRDL